MNVIPSSEAAHTQLPASYGAASPKACLDTRKRNCKWTKAMLIKKERINVCCDVEYVCVDCHACEWKENVM